MSEFLDITIAGYDEIESLIDTPFTKIISISDTSWKLEEVEHEEDLKEWFPKAQFLFSYFDDVDFRASGGPTEDEVERILAFTKKFTPSDKILVHCLAGISRSTAVAYMVLCQHTKPGKEALAFEHIEKIRPQLHPNRLIIKLADRLLTRRGRMLGAAKIRRRPEFPVPRPQL